jgi:DNA-binding NarL/FixJ family response regulator
MEEAMAEAESIGNIGALAAANADSVIALVDPSRLRRECLKLALAHHTPDRHITESSNADELIHLAAGGSRFDLVLVGGATADHIELRQIEALRRAFPETPVVVVAETDNPQRARQILSTGARGFLPASLSLRVLMGAIDLVLAGGVYVPSSLIEGSPSRPGAWQGGAGAIAEPWSELTRRQRDVLALISQGRSNKLIADALTMSESTVKAHVKQIIKRLNVANRTQAALVATGRAYFAPHARASNGAAEHAVPE